MQNFDTWLEARLNEEEGVDQVDGLFKDLEATIEKYFDQLGRAAQTTFGGKIPAKQEVIDGLKAVLAKLTVSETADAGYGEIEALLAEAEDSVVSGLSSAGTNSATGRQRYKMGDVLNSIKQRIMAKVGELHRAVVGGRLGDIHSRLLGLRNRTGQILNRTGELGGKLDGIQGTLSDPPQPLSSSEMSPARDSLAALASLKGLLGGKMSLTTRDGKDIGVSSRDHNWMNDVLAGTDKRLVLRVQGADGKSLERPVNVADFQSVSDMIDRAKAVSGIDVRDPGSPAVNGNRLRKLGLR